MWEAETNTESLPVVYDPPVRSLASYDDINYLVKTEKGTFVLKISNSHESRGKLISMVIFTPRDLHEFTTLFAVCDASTPMVCCFTQLQYIRQHHVTLKLVDVIDLQNKIMQHLNSHGIRCPMPLPSVDGLVIEKMCASSDASKSYMVRLLTFLEGQVIAELTKSNLFYSNFGTFLGSVDAALQGFDHPEAHRELAWDLFHCSASIGGALHCVDDPEKVDLIEYYLQLYKDEVLPHISSLRTGVIHNDANDMVSLTSQ